MKNLVLIFLACSLQFSFHLARAELLPEGKLPDPTLSAVLFEDAYTGFLLRSDNRTLGTVAMSLPLYRFEQDTIYAFTGIEATLRNEGATFNSESLDLRVGAKWVHPLSSHLLSSLGISHTSGHVVDDVIEKSLEPYNVGIDGIPFRLVYDSEEQWRVGLHGVVPLSSEPSTRAVIGGSFVEYYFTSSKAVEGWLLALDVYFPENALITVSTISELIYRYRQANLMVGFHSGADPRLKHQLYLKSQANFAFTGFRFEI
ncbi:MAG: hypothetical protein H7333_05180 [Bdellovibrionales bacterium]|nr:hypothetical protein [Oligoflexia bacterium]